MSAKSFSDTFPIAWSNSSSLIDRRTSVFSRSSAARVRPPNRRGPKVADFCVRGRNVRSAAMPTAAAAKIVRLIMITAAGGSPRAMKTAIVAPIRPASVNSCQGSNVGCGSVEVSELIVQAGVDRGVDWDIHTARAGCGWLRRPAARGHDDHQQAQGGEPIWEHPGDRAESTARDGEDGCTVLLDERGQDIVFALAFLDVLLQLRDLRIVAVASRAHRAVIERTSHASCRATHADDSALRVTLHRRLVHERARSAVLRLD